jgi:hypothetical protein
MEKRKIAAEEEESYAPKFGKTAMMLASFLENLDRFGRHIPFLSMSSCAHDIGLLFYYPLSIWVLNILIFQFKKCGRKHDETEG